MKLLLTAFAVLLLGFGPRSGVAAPNNHVYLPLLNCPTCAGSAPVTPTPTPDLDSVDPVRRELLALVNTARAEAGCPAAREDPLLMRITQEWSVYMAVNYIFGHSPDDWYINRGADYVHSENIGGTSRDAHYMFSGWMASPNHRGNLLACPLIDTDYVMGVGHIDSNWTFAIGWIAQ
jgi:uncharacterized protein YkwD